MLYTKAKRYSQDRGCVIELNLSHVARMIQSHLRPVCLSILLSPHRSAAVPLNFIYPPAQATAPAPKTLD
jgi:hypothetical protein